jgi:uncharacterized protein
VFFLILFPAALYARSIPAMNGPVNDLARVMNDSERASLTEYLLQVDRQTSTQIAVLTVPSLEGDDIESFSIRTASAWQLGEQDTDLGVLIVVALEEHAMRIETGYGAEAELTDAKCGLIIRNIMAPAFRNGNYGAGLSEAAHLVAEVLTGGVDAQQQITQMETDSKKSHAGTGFLVDMFFFFLFFIVVGSLGSFRRRRRFFGMPFVYTSFPRSGGFGSSGFSGGSFGGSSFRGGGGGFGGGGASGRW